MVVLLVICILIPMLPVVVKADAGTASGETSYTINADGLLDSENNSSNTTADSNWASKPMVVNIQLNLEKEGDRDLAYRILSEIERHDWFTLSLLLASSHPIIWMV